jgi:hypothetical protein
MTASTVETTAPQIAINDIGSEEDLLAAIDATIKHFNDGDIVAGRIVKVDRDEVLLDIGYKTEGVIPSRELSIKHDVDPNDVVSVGDDVAVVEVLDRRVDRGEEVFLRADVVDGDLRGGRGDRSGSHVVGTPMWTDGFEWKVCTHA